MKQGVKPSSLLIVAIILLLTGIINYGIFRPHILLFSWLNLVPGKSIIFSHNALYLFFNGYFSDIAWCAALCLVVVAFAKYRLLHISGKIFILLTPFASEIAQYFSLLPGTFDWFDILTYALIIIIFNKIFSSELIPFNMAKIKQHIIAAGVIVAFLFMVIACATSGRTSRVVADPCVKHEALNYSPVLIQINIDGSYTMKDLNGAQRDGQTYFTSALSNLNYSKYQVAQGVTPNLNVYITINTDSYNHYGATVKLYVYDDNTWFSMASNYVDIYKLFDDIAVRLNSFVVNGWHHGNCK